MSNIATAYVQIVPTTKGMSNTLSTALNGQASAAGDSAGTTLGNGLVKKALGIISAAAIGKTIVSGISAAISAGGDLQQSIGGIETLFKDASDTVIANAKKAYQTAGVSANSYMEQATSFAASLVSSLGGDVDKAAKIADTAITDMADNSNKMGTAMQDIQNAYQGFAKQNYTMLDNLKLGYGGTKTEMERLLADAEKISGVKYDISNLSDVYEAIHVIQENLGITGTTAEEAATTITGSFSMMKSAAENAMGALALGENITPSMEELADATSNFLFNNLFPMVGTTITSLPKALSSFISAAWGNIETQIETLAKGSDVGSVVQTIGDKITAASSTLSKTASTLVGKLTSGFGANLPQLAAAGVEAITSFCEGARTNLPLIMQNFGQFVGEAAGAILSNLPAIIAAGFDLISALIEGVLTAIPTLIPDMIMGLFSGIQSGLSTTDWKQLGIDILMALVNGMNGLISTLGSTLSNIWATISGWNNDVGSSVDTWASDLVDAVFEWFSQIPGKIWSAISPAVQKVTQWGNNMISSGIQAASNFINRVVSYAATLPGRIWSAIIGAISRVNSWGNSLASAGASAASRLVSSVVSGVSSLPSRMVSVGSQIVHGIISGVSSAAGSLVSRMQSLASSALKAAKNALGIKSPSRVFRDQVGQWIPAGIAAGIEGNSGIVDKALKDLADPLSSELNSSVRLSATASGLRSGESLSASEIYAAVRAGMQDATIVTNLNGREVGRSLRGMGVSFA